MNKYIIKYSCCIVYGFLFACTSPKKTNDEIKKTTHDDITSLIDDAGNTLLAKELINSTSIVVHYNGKDFIKHYGNLEKGKDNTPTDSTIYEIGSLSKVLTGTLIANAALDKKLNIEDGIIRYLDEDYSNLSYNDSIIKIKHLLTHSSGMPNILPLEINSLLTDFLNYETPTKINKSLKKYNKTLFLEDLHTIKIDTVPGTNYSYSSAGTELTAHILENIYNTEFELLLENFLSKKIGMNNTKITLSENELKNLAVGYHVDNIAIAPPMAKLPWGAGGNIKSTATDMLQFIKYQLSNDKVVKESHKVIIPFTKEIGVAYFWQVDNSDKTLGIQYLHHGGVPRSQCYLFIVPKYNMGAFIITNQSGKDTAKKMKEAVDSLFYKIIQQ